MPLNLTTSLAGVDSLANDSLSTAGKLAELKQMPVSELAELGFNFVKDLGLKIVIAFAIYIIGRWLIRLLVKFIDKLLSSRSVDISLKSFAVSLTRVVLLLLLVTIIIGVLGLDTTSFVALFASAGLAFGMAMSGTLQNFAGGVMILVLKPFKVGDVVEMQGFTGIVKEIMLFNTLVNTFDNKAVLIPNGSVSTGIINNYSHEKTRRVDWTFNIAYGDDFEVAKAQIESILNADSRVLKDPALFVALSSLADHSLEIVVRAWVNSADYWDVYFETNQKVYTTFPEKGLNFPFPQMDVHVKNK